MGVATAEFDFEIPTGFRWAGTAVGIAKPGKLDLGIMSADSPCSAAGLFTRNSFRAAPVLVSIETIARTNGRVGGVVVNSGCANAATGEEGLRNARAMAVAASIAAQSRMGAREEFLVCQTGVIGVQIPAHKVLPGIEQAAGRLAATRDAFLDFARAIMTTDTREKIAWSSFESGGRTARILACAKGSGMMHPRMATMLSFTITDVAIEPDLLQACFARVINKSINCVTIDGDTSTNDSALCLANGASGVEIRRGSEALALFEQALLRVMQSIARQLARDGEGATKLIEVQVRGAQSEGAARTVALAVANSCLVKTAIYGRDANWGRIVCAVGNSGCPVEPARVTVRLGPLTLFRLGAPLPLDEDAALKVLSEEFVPIEIDLGDGDALATVWTCDLTEKYIEINGSYRT
jgi:glutamate N-acetyltransferase / amino-acid N-acetyltransferase